MINLLRRPHLLTKIKFWRIWAKALGQKDGQNNFEADRIAKVRTVLVLLTLFGIVNSFITNIFIIAGVLRHW